MSNGFAQLAARLRRRVAAALPAVIAFAFTGAALAQNAAQNTTPTGGIDGQPRPWQMDLHEGVSPVAERLGNFHTLLLIIITVITVFVLGLLVYTMFRFRRSAHPVPTKTTHNTLVEVAWTIVPVLILVVIAVPSFRLMYYMDKAKAPEMTVKVTGHQWYWSYELPDQKVDEFASNMVPEDKIRPQHIKLLSVDYPLVVPVDTDITVLISGADVIHSWFLPQVGVQRHAVPGRTQETWMRITKPGTYYGQCNQICGTLHAYMPIEVHAVPKDVFQRWNEALAASTAKDRMRDANEKVLGMDYKWMDAPKTAQAVETSRTAEAVPAR